MVTTQTKSARGAIDCNKIIEEIKQPPTPPLFFYAFLNTIIEYFKVDMCISQATSFIF